MSIYLHLLRKDYDKFVTIQLLQSANLLIHNLRNNFNKEYLLDSEFYKEVLVYPFDFADDEIIENYMSLLKGLAVNVTIPQLRQYLLSNGFTLYTGAMTFFNYKEPLIKTASRTVILRVLSGTSYIVNDQEIDNFILSSGFFINLVNNLKESINNIARNLAAPITPTKLQQLIEEVLDHLYHFNDIFDIGREIFNIQLTNVLLKSLILPILIGSITDTKLKNYHVPSTISIYVLSKMLYVFKYENLVKKIIFLMFSHFIPRSYLDIIINPPNRGLEVLEESKEMVENPLFKTIMIYLRSKHENFVGLNLYLMQSAMNSSVDVVVGWDKIENSPERYNQFLRVFGDVILSEDNFKFFTSFVASKLIFDLSAKSFDSSLSIEKGIISNAMVKWTRNVLNLISGLKDPMVVVRVFEEEWKYVKDLCWVSWLELPLNYILPSEDEHLLRFSTESRQKSIQEDPIRYQIRLFLLYRKLNLLIIPSSIPEGPDYDSYPLKSLNIHSLELGKSYHPNTVYLKGKSIIKVTQKGITSSIRFIIEDPYFFILSQKHSDGISFVIEQLVRFSNISINDAQESYAIIINIENKNQLVIAFGDYSMWINLKNKIEKKIRECKDNDLKMLKGFIQGSK